MATDHGPADDARQRLIEAGLELFGRRGYEATSTRQLAARAGVALSAIPYHFGGKAELYRAVVASVAERLEAGVAPAAERVEAALARPDLGPEALRALVRQLLQAFARLVVGTPEAERWARLVLREQLDPTPAFEILHERVITRMHGALSALLARLRGRPRDDPDAALRAFALIGQVLVFRAARAAVLRRLGWDDVGAAELEAIGAVLDDHLRRLLRDAEETPC